MSRIFNTHIVINMNVESIYEGNGMNERHDPDIDVG